MYSQVKAQIPRKGAALAKTSIKRCTFGEQGRSRISFGAGLSRELKILLSEEDKGKTDQRQCDFLNQTFKPRKEKQDIADFDRINSQGLLVAALGAR